MDKRSSCPLKKTSNVANRCIRGGACVVAALSEGVSLGAAAYNHGLPLAGKLTDEWKTRGAQEGREYSILTAEIARAIFGVTPGAHSRLKGLNKVKTGNNLRDHPTGTLTSHRKSLIHECVTGQRRIAEADFSRIDARIQVSDDTDTRCLTT